MFDVDGNRGESNRAHDADGAGGSDDETGLSTEPHKHKVRTIKWRKDPVIVPKRYVAFFVSSK
jgi:hypothetical protein